jgi:hypothetical protein
VAGELLEKSVQLGPKCCKILAALSLPLIIEGWSAA